MEKILNGYLSLCPQLNNVNNVLLMYLIQLKIVNLIISILKKKNEYLLFLVMNTKLNSKLQYRVYNIIMFVYNDINSCN